MSVYSQGYEELGGLPATTFEKLWEAYSKRSALDRLDREYSRQRTVIESAEIEPTPKRNALAQLDEAYEDLKAQIEGGEARKEQTEFTEEKWWVKPDAA